MMLDIAYENYHKSSDIHGSVLYPGIMIAPAQNAILQQTMRRYNHPLRILDPFCGSGTALYEAAKLNPKNNITGIDINPLATLITRCKLEGITSLSDITQILTTIGNQSAHTHVDEFTFPKKDKWYRADIAESLTILRNLIMQVENPQNRRFLWLIFADVAHRCSNTRSSTFKLHVKATETITNMKNDAITYFLAHAARYAPYYTMHHQKHTIITADSTNQTREIPSKSIDITITSPPYGDNLTTITYGQFSSLALQWIPNKDLHLNGWEKDNYSIIDSKSLGNLSKTRYTHWDNEELHNALEKIQDSKRKKVSAFMDDYYSVLNQITRITRHHVIMTLGDRTVDGIKIPLTTTTSQFLQDHGFHHQNTLVRTLQNKRIPTTTSHVHGNPIPSMTKETTLIYTA